MNKPLTLTIAFMALLVLLNPIVASAQQTETIEGTIYLNPENKNYTQSINIANTTDSKYSNFNLSIKPLIENVSITNGRVIAPLLFPYIIDVEETYNSLSMGHFVRFKSDQIMNGISRCWLRLPITNLSGNSIFNIRIYRSWISRTSFNVNFTDAGPVFNQPGAMKVVYNYTDTTTPENQIWYNNTINQTVNIFNTNYNVTWIKINAPILPGERYFIYYNFTEITNNSHLLYSPCDVLDDSEYNSWIKYNATEYYIAADLDLSIIATLGLGAGIGGIKNSETLTGFQNYITTYNKTVDKILTNASNSFLNYLIPIYANEAVNATHRAFLVANDSAYAATNLTHQIINGTTFITGYKNISSALPIYISDIIVQVSTTIQNSSKISYYIENKEDFTGKESYIFTYFRNVTLGTNKLKDKLYFSIFGFTETTDSYWKNIRANYSIIYAEEPTTEAELIEIYSAYIAGTINGDELRFSNFEAFIFGLTHPLKAILLLLEESGLIDDARNALSNTWSKIAGFGVYLWEVISFTIDALMYVGYLALKSFYGILSVLIYYFGIFSLLGIMSSFEAYFFLDSRPAKKLKKRDIRKEAYTEAINMAWNKSYKILSLIIGMFLIAFAIFNAIRSLLPVV